MEKVLIPNSTQTPNIILDMLIPGLPEAEARCILYIVRRTFGFHKEIDRISFTQFMDGIKDKEGNILDKGTGLSRPSVNEALKNLIKAGAIDMDKDSKGNYYSINLDMDIDKVVKKVNWLRKLTRSGKAGLPKQVKLLNPQKKGNKEKQSICEKDFSQSLYLEEMERDKRRGIQIVALWIKLNGFKFDNADQIHSFIKRNLRPSNALSGYTNEDITKTFNSMVSTEWLTKYTLETVAKFIDEVKNKVGSKSYLEIKSNEFNDKYGHLVNN